MFAGSATAVPAPGRRRETVAKPVAAAARPIGTSIGRCVALGTRSGQGHRQSHSRHPVACPAKLAGQCRPIDVDLSIALPGQRAGEGVTAGRAGKRLPLDGELRHSRARGSNVAPAERSPVCLFRLSDCRRCKRYKNNRNKEERRVKVPFFSLRHCVRKCAETSRCGAGAR